MTPREKALELVDKYIPHVRVFHESLGWEDYLDSAKKCVLITVEEVQLQIYNSGEYHAKAQIGWWDKVKSEIEGL